MFFFLLQRNPEISHILNNPDLMRQVNFILETSLKKIEIYNLLFKMPKRQFKEIFFIILKVHVN